MSVTKSSGASRRGAACGQSARTKGRGDALDGHPLYTRLKVSAALAALARRFEMTEEDWQFSGAILAVSDGARSEVEAAVRQVVEGGGVVDTALDAANPRVTGPAPPSRAASRRLHWQSWQQPRLPRPVVALAPLAGA